MTITAKFEDGVFKPLEEVAINEGTIVEVCIPSSSAALIRNQRSIGDFAFFGLWKDRTEMADGVEYLSDLRRNLRG